MEFRKGDRVRVLFDVPRIGSAGCGVVTGIVKDSGQMFYLVKLDPGKFDHLIPVPNGVVVPEDKVKPE